MVLIGVLLGLCGGLCNQVGDAHIGSRNTGSDAVELALQLRQHDKEGFGDSNKVGHEVHSSNTVTE